MPVECNLVDGLALVGYPFSGPTIIEPTDDKWLCERFFAEDLSPLNFWLRQKIFEKIPNVLLGTPQQIELNILHQGFNPAAIILEARGELSNTYLRNVWDSASNHERAILEFQKKPTATKIVEIKNLAGLTRLKTKILVWGNGSADNSDSVGFAEAMQNSRTVNYLQEQKSKTLSEAMFQYCGIKN
ncbi:MAG: hypothetical protein K9L85_02885 [Candidatus Peribacteraceae bacterium]|nr:hypothetical protein [Candidatus Peribacteraceae bacterium]